MIPLRPPGTYEVSYEELKQMGGAPVLPKRIFIRKIRREDPYWMSQDFMMFIAYPWILSDERDGRDLLAFRTWEEAYAKAYALVTEVPQAIIRLNELSARFDVAEFINKYIDVPRAGTHMIAYTCNCGHIAGMHDYGSDGMKRDGCAVCDCRKSRNYVRQEIKKRSTEK